MTRASLRAVTVPKSLETVMYSTAAQILMVWAPLRKPPQLLTRLTVLHFWGFTVYTGEVETAILTLPYIANAVVLPLVDKKQKECTAAILQIRPEYQLKRPGLDTLRKDLEATTSLMLFKIPTVIYWLQAGEEISLTVNGKISKVDARKRFFGDDWQTKDGVEVMDLSAMEYWRMGGQC